MSGLVTFLSGTTHVFREIFRVTCCLTSNFSTLNSTFACQFSASLKTRLQCRPNSLRSTLDLIKFLSAVCCSCLRSPACCLGRLNSRIIVRVRYFCQKIQRVINRLTEHICDAINVSTLLQFFDEDISNNIFDHSIVDE